ncbi:MAG: FKBP-type peptidyl-prolyl cis-trans isomerase [Bacteroidia bacterium]|nr:FKBP-type peptidyl-prolyl cis-trans isomerase [Bacteroidia bacterium]
MKNVFFMLSLLALATGCADKEVVLSDAEQLDKDIAIIDKWLALYNPNALTDPSGLRYVLTTAGTGAKPSLSNSVVVKYSGKFLNDGVSPDKSAEFDKSTTAVTFKLSSLIAGWQIGFQLLPKGSKATLYIPSGLGYGKNGAGSAIPPNANLFFDVELIDVK